MQLPRFQLELLSVLCLALSLTIGFPAVHGAEPTEASAAKQSIPINFVRDIQPIFKKHCYLCHGHDVQEGNLRLDRREHALKGGDSGPAILPGKPNESPLAILVSGKDPDGRIMPPPDEAPALNSTQRALLIRWIQEGASWPTGADDEELAGAGLWSLKKVVSSGMPTVKNKDWLRNPIDSFILQRLEQQEMLPAESLPALALARRAAFDLTGLPLLLEDLNRFEAENEKDSERAYRNLVDRLLASQHYGERWGRHWLDLARYADSNGYEVDGVKPMAWKYRDYVIRALNKDKPYNRFIMEQLAGDELVDVTSETIIATGFIRVGPWDAERGASVQPSEVVEELYNELDDQLSTTSQVFLGLTVGCARCHDHKFDPISTEDYYSMVAIFRGLKREHSGRTEKTRPAVPPRELVEKNAADAQAAKLIEKIQKLGAPLRSGILESGESKLPEDAVAAFGLPIDKRSDEQKQLVQRWTPSLDKRVGEFLEDDDLAGKHLPQEIIAQIRLAQSEVTELKNKFDYPEGYFFHEPSSTAPLTHLLKRGSSKNPGKVVQPAILLEVVEQFGEKPPLFEAPDEFTSRRRISLARWIARKDNPLTTRVIVNRVWQFHFGQGLVRTPSDFGRRGVEPTHPELLDYLSDWFVNDADWSVKKLHRLIMESSTYRMGKSQNVEYAVRDPSNRYLWRFPNQRLEVEAIRDAMLAVSGQLNRQLYGPSMYPKIPEDALQSGYNPTDVWKEFDETDASRRTIYAYLKRTLVVPFLDTLDFCDTTTSTGRRNITTVAPQALELLNGEFSNRQAVYFADRLIAEESQAIPEKIHKAYRLALGRAPTQTESETLAAFVDNTIKRALAKMPKAADANERLHKARRKALIQMCRILFNLNEFVYTD